MKCLSEQDMVNSCDELKMAAFRRPAARGGDATSLTF